MAIDSAQLQQQPQQPQQRMAEPATPPPYPYTALAAEPPAAPEREKPAANGGRSAGPTQPVVHDPLLKDLDPKKDLPTPLQLWRFIFNDLLFGNPNWCVAFRPPVQSFNRSCSLCACTDAAPPMTTAATWCGRTCSSTSWCGRPSACCSGASS